MSTPIADHARYFKEKRHHSSQPRSQWQQQQLQRPKPQQLKLSLPMSYNQDTDVNQVSPDSPHSQPLPERSPVPSSPTTAQLPRFRTAFEGRDAHAHWMRVKNKIRFSANNTDVEESSDQEEILELHNFTEEPSEISGIGEDVLPSIGDLESVPDSEEEAKKTEEGYFANPFAHDRPDDKPAAILEAPQITKPKPTAQPESSVEPTKRSRSARSHWEKSFGRIKMITNMKAMPQRQSVEDIKTSASLVPYYPPLFAPPFIYFSKTENDRKLPPILVQCLHVEVTDSKLSTHTIPQWVFRIELQYGYVKWVINRTIADFVALHYKLKFKSNLFDQVPAPPAFPSQLQSWINSAKETLGIDRDGIESEAKDRELSLRRREELTVYLRELLSRAHMTFSYDVCEFFEISAISIVQDMGWKGKEGYIDNRVNFVTPRLCHILRPHLWYKQWVILRDSYIAFSTDIASSAPKDVLMVDKSLTVKFKKSHFLSPHHHHIVVENKFRRIEIRGSKRETREWMEDIEKIMKSSPWIHNHRFGSFAPIRQNAKVKWYVDAEDHFAAVAEAILSAKSEIYIADWWLSPEIYLRRPPEKNEEFRLDRLLQRKARQGVMIYIIIYKEMSVALTINSSHTKYTLQNLHPNIIVQRHPDHRSIDNTVLFWSHHEKIVVVDNRLAFIGGLDLCYGRYDTHNHQLTDYAMSDQDLQVFPGQDYSNPRVRDFEEVARHDLTLVDRKITPRMPWHDVTVGANGPIARDIARHFIQRWNFVKASKGMRRSAVPFLMPKGEYVAARDETKFKGSCRVQLLRSSAEWSSGVEREHSIYNAYMECISKAKHYIYIENQFFISTTFNDKLLRNKIAQAIVERIKRAHHNGEKFKIYILIPLIPAFQGDLASSDASAARNVMHYQYSAISRGGNSIIEKLIEAGINPKEYVGWYCLRTWSKLSTKKPAKTDSGTVLSDQGSPHHDPQTTEIDVPLDVSAASSSISWNDDYQNASQTHSATSGPTSLHTDELQLENDEDDDRQDYVSELVYIHDKIMIVDDRIVLIGSANINDRSQLGNRDSEIAMLIEDNDLVPSYMNGLQYRASKFAILLRMRLWKEHLGLIHFTDWSSIIGSQDDSEHALKNVPRNPPSAQGVASSTESELAGLEGTDPDIVLDKGRQSSPSSSPRENDTAYRALDPLSDHFSTLWCKTARTNTVIYRDLFHCVPDDTVHTFEQHHQFLPNPTIVPHGHVADPGLSSRDIRKRLSQVRGHLVEFPTEYLKSENMLGSVFRETVTPMIIFT